MISKNPEQRQQYEARLKFQRDEAARLEGAISEGIKKGRVEGRVEGRQEGRQEGLQEGMEKGIEVGIEKGIQKGALLGRITLLQELLGILKPTEQELTSFDEVQLLELAEDLKRRLRTRGE